MRQEPDIRDLIGSLIENKIDFDGFEDQLVSKSWSIRSWGTVESQLLVFTVELAIAEYHQNALSYEELRSQLHSTANTFNCSPTISTASTTQLTGSTGWQFGIAPAGMQLSTASSLPTPR